MKDSLGMHSGLQRLWSLWIFLCKNVNYLGSFFPYSLDTRDLRNVKTHQSHHVSKPHINIRYSGFHHLLVSDSSEHSASVVKYILKNETFNGSWIKYTSIQRLKIVEVGNNWNRTNLWYKYTLMSQLYIY